MSTNNIDERVVGMKFDNVQFEREVATTLRTLENLNKSLKLEGAARGLSDVAAAANHVQLGHLAGAVDGIADKFHALSVAAITAFSTVVNQAVNAGERLAKSLTLDPINAGLQEYQTNINSIQTILSNTRWQNTGLDDVNNALQQLNDYSDLTIYNFSQMARNIGTFTAAGVKLEVATGAIKGIANLAAVSGSSAEQASSAMYQLSQAIATGTVKLIDWNSVVNAGMGGKVFQDALMRTAKVHGVAIDKMIKEEGSFRATLEKGWLTSDILTETLQQFTGDLTEAQLISMGYTQQQATDILAMGQDALNAATKVKTISQLMNTLQESAGSGWAKTWQLIFGDFDEARDLFTGVNDVLGGFIKASADARNNVLQDWKEMGGRTILIEAISNAFNALLDILRPIKEAFREIFPAATGHTLLEMTKALRDFTASLRVGSETADLIKRSFAGVFAILGIGWEIVKKTLGVIFDLFGVVTHGSGGFLKTTASIGDFLVALHKAIKDGTALTSFFHGLSVILALPIRILQALGNILATLFGHFDADKAGEQVGNFVDSVEPLGKVGDFLNKSWDAVVNAFREFGEFLGPIAKKIGDLFGGLGDLISGATKDLDFSDFLGAVNTGLFAGLVLIFHDFFSKGGILGNFGAAIRQVTETLESMQNTLRALTLIEIAIALGILAVSLNQLSKIDAGGLTRSLTAMGVMITELFGSLLLFEKLSSTNFAGIVKVTFALILLAVAIRLLTGAVKDLAEMSWEDLGKGMAGLVVMLGALVATVRLMPDEKKMISSSLGLIAIAAAVKILVSAVADLAVMSWEDLAKGLVGVGAILGGLILFSKFAEANKGGLVQGAGILLLAVAIKILSDAMANIVSLDGGDIAKSLITIAIALGLITAALKIIPPDVLLSAAGVLVVAIALGLIGDALKSFGAMSVAEIAKGLITLALALTIIVVAMQFMPEALPGALALLVVAAALKLMAGVIATMAEMSWGTLAKGLGIMALALIGLGLTALVITPLLPLMLALGLAVTLIGAGLALAGAGIFLFAAGLLALKVAGEAGADGIRALLDVVVSFIPKLAENIGQALLILIGTLIEATPKIVDLILLILVKVIEGLTELLPKVFTLIEVLITGILDLLVKAVPQMVVAGLKLLTGILRGIADNIHDVIDAAVDVIVNFIQGIADNIPRIIQSGVDLILSFIEGLTKAINDNSEKMGKAGGDLAVAIVKGMVKGIQGGAGEIADAARDAAKSALKAAMKFLGINSPSKEFEKVGKYSDQGFAQGLDKFAHLAETAATGVGKDSMSALKDSMRDLSDAVSGDIDLVPTITPVLDLSAVQKASGQISSILAAKPLTVDTTYSAAQAASSGHEANQTAAADQADQPAGTQLNFTQYNTSPKALTPSEIYRQTNNQLSKVKGVLPV